MVYKYVDGKYISTQTPAVLWGLFTHPAYHSMSMFDSDPLAKTAVRYRDKTVGEVRTHHDGKVFLWFQDPLKGYNGQDWFSISEGVLSEIPTDCTRFVAKTNENKCYTFERLQFETGLKIPIYDDFFSHTPPEPQYAVPIHESLRTFDLRAYDSRDVNFRK